MNAPTRKPADWNQEHATYNFSVYQSSIWLSTSDVFLVFQALGTCIRPQPTWALNTEHSHFFACEYEDNSLGEAKLITSEIPDAWTRIEIEHGVYLTCQSKIVVRKCMEPDISQVPCSSRLQKTARNPHGVNSTSRFGISKSQFLCCYWRQYASLCLCLRLTKCVTMLLTRDFLKPFTGRGEPRFEWLFHISQRWTTHLARKSWSQVPRLNIPAVAYLMARGAVRADMGASVQLCEARRMAVRKQNSETLLDEQTALLYVEISLSIFWGTWSWRVQNMYNTHVEKYKEKLEVISNFFSQVCFHGLPLINSQVPMASQQRRGGPDTFFAIKATCPKL